MKKNKTQYIILKCLAILVLVLVVIFSATAQSTHNEDEKDDGQPSLQGLTEVVLVDGQPALRLLSPKNGSTEVKFQKRDGEDALVFTVWVRKSRNVSTGSLFVTKSKIIYDPSEKKKNYFNIDKDKIKEIKIERKSRAFAPSSFVNIKGQDMEQNITTLFTAQTENNKEYSVPANNFLAKSFTNFDSALQEFNKLTASVRPDSDEEEVEEEELEVDIYDKYDRFQDITIISTSKILVRGNKRSIRSYADYSFSGKTQKQPEVIKLYFYASASRPVFQEDNLRLNFLVDNERVPLGEMKIVDEEKTKTATKQTLSIEISYKTFEQIANGKIIEFQIGNLEYKFNDIHLEAFRKLLTYKIEE